MLSSIKSALPDAVKAVPAAAAAQITRPGRTSAAAGYADDANVEEDAVKPPPLARPVAIAVATASRLVATSSSDNTKASEAWLAAVLDYLQLDADFLPPLALDETSAAKDDAALRLAPFLTQAVSIEERPQVVHALLYASIFPPTTTNNSTSKSVPSELAYTAPARARVLASLTALGLSRAEAGVLLVEQERVVADELYAFLREGAERAKAVEEEVERNRRERENGWGGKWGRWMATGAGVVLGGVALGLTGGLAAPAILALLPSTLGLLTPATAPSLLGGLFGTLGGGLTGKRVSKRWAGVGEFEFVEVGDGGDARKQKDAEAKIYTAPYAIRQKKKSAAAITDDSGHPTDALATLSLDPSTFPLTSSSSSPNTSIDPPVTVVIPSKPPSLTVVIALTGLLTEDADEGVRCWEGVARAPLVGPPAPPIADHAGPLDEKSRTRLEDVSGFSEDALEEEEKERMREAEEEQGVESVLEMKRVEGERIAGGTSNEGVLLLRERDIFVGRVETAEMVSTGKALNEWVTNKIIAKAGKEILKRTVVNAYLSAVALPLTVYGWAGTALDNTWQRAVDKARKAGQVLADILLARVQGSRPITLIGHSLGALTVLSALQALGVSSEKHAMTLVDAAFLIALPSAPSRSQWAEARRAAGRRLVNGWSGKDIVLGSVVRLHEVVGGLTGGGVTVAGLGAVGVEGVEDVDLSSVVQGHFAINKNMPEILRLLKVDE